MTLLASLPVVRTFSSMDTYHYTVENRPLDDLEARDVSIATAIDGFYNSTTGNLLVGNGKGVDFSSTADGTGVMTNEVLNDYEEGTFTPSLSFVTPGDISVVYTPTPPVGSYTKIGNRVHFNLYVATSTFTYTTSSGIFEITGLPFTASADSQACAMSFAGITGGGTSYAPYVVSSSTKLRIYGLSNAGAATTDISNTHIASGTLIALQISGTYKAV